MSVEVLEVGRNSEAKLRANAKYNKKIYESIGVRSRKENRIGDLLDLASKKTNKTKSVYVIDAIQSQLARDGITIDMLPDASQPVTPVVEVKQPKQYLVYMITSWMVNEEDFQEYVSTFGTLGSAKTYIKNKYSKKPYPNEWFFTIYGRMIEADTKLEATNKYRQMTMEAVKEEQNNWMNPDGYYDFLHILEEKYGEPESVEIVKYDDVKD